MNETVTAEYAKRIYGFAYSKTGNCHDADDLSQEIALSLCGIDFPEKQIDNMDAYIYRVCRYTWSKYLRKNKPAWESAGNAYCLDLIESDEDAENDIIRQELFDRLRREIMYLGRIRREAIIMFYYDGKSGDEISSALDIPPATVRWHLYRAKNELKERIEMNERDGIYRPVRLSVGLSGNCDNDVMRMLESDTLTQNICWVCFGDALTVEEISRTLGVAAVYLEDKLDGLCSMEYMTRSAKGKYRTNFFIRGAEYQLEHSRYQYEKTLPLALGYYNAVKEALPEIRKAGFIGEVNDDILMWDMLLYFMFKEIASADDRMIAELGLEHGSPIRPDGTRHWVRAAVACDDIAAADVSGDKDFHEFLRDANGFGMQGSNVTPAKVKAVQLNIPFMSDRRVFGLNEINEARSVANQLDCSGEVGELDKIAASYAIEKGYAAQTDGKPMLLVPYFNAAQSEAVNAILAKYADAMLDRDADERLFIGYAEHMKRFIPACVCDNERSHYLTSYDPYNAIFWLLAKNGYLRLPDAAERKYICTVMWDY